MERIPREALNKSIPLMVRQAHHERNQQLAVRPEPVEGFNQRFPSLKAIIETGAIGIIGGRPDITIGKVSIYDVGYGAMLPGCVANMNGTLLLENAPNLN